MLKSFIRIGILCLILTVLSCNKPAQKVYLIPTLHGMHRLNKNYTYDSLKKVVNGLNPDIIAVEIRPEDVGKDTTYLRQNYPYEMWMMRYWFPGSQIRGIDWLGSDVEGKIIPENYWRDLSPIKKYQRALSDDSIYANRCRHCDSLLNERLELLQDLSLKKLLASDDSGLTRKYYNCLQNQIKGSIHQRVLDFYQKRNDKMLVNIRAIIKNNPGKTIVIITGDDHYVYFEPQLKHEKLFL